MNVKYFVNYIRTMKCYFYFLILQLIAVISLIVYVFIDFGKNHAQIHVFAIECALTIIIIFEIMTRMISNKREFFGNLWNIADLIGIIIITSLFFGLVFFESQKGAKHSEESDLIPAVLLGARYFAQIFRIMLTLKQSHDVRNVVDHIVFDNEAEQKSETHNTSHIDNLSIRV